MFDRCAHVSLQEKASAEPFTWKKKPLRELIAPHKNVAKATLTLTFCYTAGGGG
jgi:hypothetical protein